MINRRNYSMPLFVLKMENWSVTPKIKLMKQSLIITVILCLVLAKSFSIISKKEKVQQKTTTYCCVKSGGQPADKQAKTTTEPASYIPMVNILGYN